MRSTFKLLFYINRNKVKSDSTTAVLCRISIDGKKSAVTTGIYCRPGDWDSKKCEIKTVRENNRLAAFRSRLEEAYANLLRNQGVVTAELLKTTVSGANSVPEYLLQAGEVERERLRIRSKEINSTSTYRQSKTTQLNLRQFVESRGMRDIAFSDITGEFAESFKVFLKKELGHRNGHVNHCLCWLNRLIYIAVDREVLRANPIEDVAYEKKDAPKLRHISRNELKRMMETPMPDPMMELARRTFIFSCMTGLAYADTRALHPRHIGRTSEGRRYIRIRRAKTDVEAFIPLHPVAEQILELYNTTDEGKPVFPLPVRDVLWYEVHGMGVALGMRENLSYHMARHSFGTLTLTAGIPIESIARMMGHTNIDSTQVYAQVTDRKISSDMDRLMERKSLNLNTILYQCRVIILLQQLLDVRLPVQDLPTELDIGNPSLVPVILQAPAADLQCLGKLPVGQEPFPVEGRTVVTGKTFHFFLYIVQQGEEPADAPVFLIDNSFHFFRSLKVSVLSSFPHRLLLASDADVGHQPLHVLRFVIELPLEAGERQPSGIAEGL